MLVIFFLFSNQYSTKHWPCEVCKESQNAQVIFSLCWLNPILPKEQGTNEDLVYMMWYESWNFYLTHITTRLKTPTVYLMLHL